eukprot:5267713-Prymnesium_polylepis.1
MAARPSPMKSSARPEQSGRAGQSVRPRLGPGTPKSRDVSTRARRCPPSILVAAPSRTQSAWHWSRMTGASPRSCQGTNFGRNRANCRVRR